MAIENRFVRTRKFGISVAAIFNLQSGKYKVPVPFT